MFEDIVYLKIDIPAPLLAAPKLNVPEPSVFKTWPLEPSAVGKEYASLTVNEVYDNKFSVNIIDYTWNETTFNLIEVSQCINFEIDIISRYLLNKRKNYLKWI